MNDARTPTERAAEDAAESRDRGLAATFRSERGVVHTPFEVARFAAAQVDDALLGLGRSGIADPDVVLVDPACGPGVYLASALAIARRGAPRVVLGMDVDAAALARAGEVLDGPARDAGWDLRWFSGNTLEAPLPLPRSLTRGATIVVIGNPPWAGRTSNRSAAYTDTLLTDFRRMPDGTPLAERKIGVLSDDYVRFFRWAAEVARNAEGGAVVSLTTNSSFLDGPVHRGMRAALGQWFDRIDVTDLGGSALIARRGDRDENVFKVRPGAAVTLAIRPAGHREQRQCIVRYAALRGAREDKLARLVDQAPPLRAVSPAAPLYRFDHRPDDDPRYAAWPSLAELMPFHREGVQTNRDRLCIDVSRAALVARLEHFAAGGSALLGVASAHYDPEAARVAVASALEDLDASRTIRPIAYRPFDTRWVATIPRFCHRPRPELLRAVDRSECVLLTVRKDRGERAWTHFGLTTAVPDNCYLSTRSSCRTRAFPTHRPDGAPNVDPELLGSFAARLSSVPAVGELLRYVLAFLGAALYRERFDAHLRSDYPRLPPPPSERAFVACVEAGDALAACFLSSAHELAPRGVDGISIGHHRVGGSPSALRDLMHACGRCDDTARPILGDQ